MATNFIDKTVKTDLSEGPAGQYTKKTKNDIYVQDISDPNMLYDFASYNALFTLSGLSQRELENTTTLLRSKGSVL
jgi:hypothetical protein